MPSTSLQHDGVLVFGASGGRIFGFSGLPMAEQETCTSFPEQKEAGM